MNNSAAAHYALPSTNSAPLYHKNLVNQDVSDFDTLPDNMKQARRWLVWKSIPNEDPAKKPKKIPFYANGFPRNGTMDTPEDLANFASFEDALTALQTGKYTGLGFALGQDGTGNYWQGVDFDHLSEHPELQLLKDDLSGYTESSPSGDGLHAIGYGRHFKSMGSNASGIEAYSNGRFFTVTAEGSGINDPCCMADFVEQVLRPMHGRHESSKSEVAAIEQVPVSPQIISDLRSALLFMRSDDRELWVRVGHALKCLGDTGRGLWLEWSSTSSKYDPLQDAQQWEGFKPTLIDHRAVFTEAQNLGWINPKSKIPIQASNDATFKVVNIADVFTNPPPPQQYIWGERIPVGVLTLLSGHGGTGKSLLALQLGICTAIGKDFLGLETAQAKTLFFSAEDSRDTVRRRVAGICESEGINPVEAAKNLIVLDATDASCLFEEASELGVKRGVVSQHYMQLKQLIETEAVQFLVVDNASDTFGANPIDRQAVTRYIRELVKLVQNQNGAVFLLSHVNKQTSQAGAYQTNSEGYADCAAWHNASRSRLFLNATNDGTLTLQHQKNNYGKKQTDLAISFSHDGSSLHLLDSTDFQKMEENRNHALRAKRLPLLKLVNEFYQRSEWISISKSANTTHAHALLKNEPSYPFGKDNTGKNECFAVLSDCEREQLIIKETYQTRHRNTSCRWALTEKGLKLISENIEIP